MEEEQSEFLHWDELLPDVLGLIFSYLSLQELPTIIPCVRKSWRKAITGPYCCQDIDLAKWSRRCRSHHLDRMLQMLITRSNGSLRSLHVSVLFFLALASASAGSLQVLRLPRSEMVVG
ncbi:hypothetical protein Godav_003554 [Gossypium davidsonii]|uniref:F-box domain-containing protein n=1 Tax=Gossypium davidsonii TaxID=34287 RepID=A0A7J8SJK2_GOSDV|nr:hypothetical protein [Gossypium davidsonii]